MLGPAARRTAACLVEQVACRDRATAAAAVAHSILNCAYHVLTEETVYRDQGGDAFDERDR